jgi:hypothetical protein
MGFHLQLFPPKFWDWMIVLLVLFLPAAATAYVLHNLAWFLVVPFGIIVLAFLIAAALPRKRKVTPQQFADELEKHLLGTEGKWGWDDVTSVAIADDRLELIRWGLPKFDSLSDEKDREELRGLIAALRRGEVPEVVPPSDLTYRVR